MQEMVMQMEEVRHQIKMKDKELQSINATVEFKDNLWNRLKEQTGMFRSDSEVILAIKNKQETMEAATQCTDP